MFGRSQASLCRIFLKRLNMIYDRWSKHLFFCLDVVTVRLNTYYDAVKRKGGSVAGVFVFLNGTKVATCLVTWMDNLQKQLFIGHNRPHCLNFQGLTASDSLCVHCWGATEGIAHDATLLCLSGYREYLEERAEAFDNRFVYRDPTYGKTKFCGVAVQKCELDGGAAAL